MTDQEGSIPFSEFWDNPADCPANRSDYDETVRRYRQANAAVSVSGTVCKLVGVAAAVIGPALVFTHRLPFATAAAAVGSGAAIAAIGSSATSNKRTAQLTALTAWHSFNS